GAGYQAGIFSSSAADTTISYGQVGARAKTHDLTISGLSDIGAWRDVAGQSGYFGYRLGLALEMKPGWIIDGDTQYVRYKPDNDLRVWRTGFAWHVVKPATVQSSYYISSIDRRPSPALSARTDLAVRRTTVIAGLVVGVHRSFFDDRGVAEPASREYFGGCQVPVKRTTITGLVDVTTSPVRKGRTV